MKTEQLYRIFREESAGVSTDSRNIKKGQLFFALWGQNFNGNKYASEAIDKGASYAVIDDPVYESEKTILVDDCLLELSALALWHRKLIKAPVLAITGTNGKTTTKELIAAIMSKKLKVHFTKGNLNNEIGLPLTILSAPDDTEMMILELGANHLGEIRSLCNVARPDYGIITNIGTAHLEGFGSFEGVLKAKTELYEHLRKVNGIAIYDDKNPFLTEKIYKLVNRGIPYSNPTGVELVVEALPSEMNLAIIVKYQHKTYEIQTGLFGAYNLGNLKAAIATGLFLGVGMDEIAEAIGKYQPGNNRSQIKTTPNNTLVCDSYNANPTSMVMAIESFNELKTSKKVLILGDMLELGDKSEEEHLRVIEMLKSKKPGKILLVGTTFQKTSSGTDFKSFNDVGKLREYLKAEPLKGNLILIKGSRGMTLEKIYDIL
ncbi:MAG TPA: UDP-N-acetylmuramoyl-tripeptide--D-alanyl-D-alanine ligase [Bacteroidales bacterium]|nr:UDP-N-acetylmuramoyl-tripeptide--D-alanyl-D-alanine ligase [Bacteroidales bacterium]HBZ22415.1 UDP-N-acetylmuramoyl-tripeptide--D-alanyl-D-alanine ligase [Bacteroidales bacterium]